MAATESIILPETTLVRHVLAQGARAMPASTRERLAQALLDWFTAGWSATLLPAAGTLRGLAADLFPCAGDAAVFGGADRATPLAAAFANAGITHLREIDDAHRAAMLHPGVVAVSPVLALAPSLGLTRGQAARAIVAGYEVALRIGEALGTRHAAVFHATATAGSIGAAAATGIALGLDESRFHHALGIAATQAAGLWQLVDDNAHEAKSLHPAFAVRNGLTAAYAARAGLPGAQAFVTGQRGLYAALAGGGPLAALDGDLESTERLNTATIKAWPCCAQLFTPLDATLALIQEHRIGAGDVAHVEVTIFPHALKIAGVQWPNKAAEASFSLRYLTAILLSSGRIGIADTETLVRDTPTLRALGDRISVHTDDEFQKAFPTRRPSRVTITLHDRRQLSAYRELRRGDPEDPFTWSALVDRLHAFAPAIGNERAQALTAWCEAFVDPARDGEACAPAPALFGVDRD